MKVNIDFLVSGCSTQCVHCYVNGGPGPFMQTDDALACIEKLDQISALLPEEASFTLDHEPMNHPEIAKILHAASHTKHIINYHHGMTAGVGFMARCDKEAVVKSYLENRYNEFGITLHGVSAHHDEIVNRKGAFDKTINAARFFSRQGCRVQISLMMNRFFAEDAGRISCLIDDIGAEDIYFAVPIFTPHSNMMRFEPYRATLETFESIYRYLPGWNQNPEEVMERARRNSVGGVGENVQYMDLRRLWKEKQDVLYLTLHQDCTIYVGNSGAETQALGDLRKLNPKFVAEIIQKLPGNYDYSAYYDIENVPDAERVWRALKAIPQDLVYGDFASALYRAFVELAVPTKLLSKA